MNSSDVPVKSGPREVFLHLLAIVTLYLAAIAFGTLIFQLIDYYLPDPLANFPRQLSDAVRWALAAIVIVFPAYVWTAWTLRRDEVREPARRELRIRKWLLYFTLFAAAVVIIGDLIVLIYNFLSGGLSGRFVLKIATVLFVAVAVFVYYLWNLRTAVMASRHPQMRWFVYGIIALVAAATVNGFLLAGSPLQERARRFDDRRVENLQEIQWQIVNFWQHKERLPASLNELRDEIAGFVPPRDPETGTAYEYRMLSTLKFELCATFRAVSRDAESGAGAPKPITSTPARDTFDIWAHEAGRVCFERTIDPERYPPFRELKGGSIPQAR